MNPVQNSSYRTSVADEMREEHRRRVLIRCYAFRNGSGSFAILRVILPHYAAPLKLKVASARLTPR